MRKKHVWRKTDATTTTNRKTEFYTGMHGGGRIMVWTSVAVEVLEGKMDTISIKYHSIKFDL